MPTVPRTLQGLRVPTALVREARSVLSHACGGLTAHWPLGVPTTMNVAFKGFQGWIDKRLSSPRFPAATILATVADDGSGEQSDGLSAISTRCRSILLLSDVGPAFAARVLLLLGRHPELTSRTRMAGITDEWLKPLSSVRRKKFLEFAVFPAEPEAAGFVRALQSHRSLVQRLYGPFCADILLSGQELHHEAFFTFFRTRLPFLPHLRRVGWLPPSSRKLR